MTPAVISILIMVGVGAMIAIALTIQSIENARKERHRQVLALRERVRLAEDLLTSIPPEYLPEQLHQLLISYILGRCREIQMLEPKDPYTPGKIAQFEELAKQPYQSNPDNAHPVFIDQLSARNARSRIKELASLIIAMNKEGLLDKSAAKQHIQTGKLYYALLGLDIALLTARAVDSSDNHRLALTHYKQCLLTLEKLAAHLTLENKRAVIEQRIAELESEIKTEDEHRAEEQDEHTNEEWDNFGKQDWQIKQEYE